MTTHLPPQEPIEPDTPLPGEAELSALYRQLPPSEPGPALDAAVLRAAAAAITSQASNGRIAPMRRSRGRTTPPRWLVGLATAATLVIVAGVAWQMRGMPQRTSLGDKEAIRQQSSTMASTAAPVSTDANSVLHAAATPAALPAPQTPPRPAPETSALNSRVVSVPEASNPPNAYRRTLASMAVTQQSRHATPPPAVEELTAVTPAVAKPETYISAYSVKKTQANNTDLAQASERQSVVEAPSARIIVSSAPAPMPAPAPPTPPAASAESATADRVAMRPERSPEPSPPTIPAPMPAMPAPPVPPAPMPAAASPPSSMTADTTERPGDTPAQELGKISTLFAQNHADEGQQRLRRFHRDYPQWDLPPSLRARLHEP